MNGLLAAGVFVSLLVALQVQARGVSSGTVPQHASRKLGHVGLGTTLVATWPLFGAEPSGRFFAAAPALGLAVYFLALGLGWIRDDAVVRAAARSEDPRELLTGPLLYVVPFGILVIIFGPSLIAAVALGCLVFGDAMAEVAGRGLRTPILPWSRDKTWGGLAGAWFGGVVGASAFVVYLGAVGPVDLPFGSVIGRLTAVAATGALIESISSGEVDNLAIVVGTTVSAALLF